MKDVYHRLARKLDDLAHGFPSTESGVELKILERVFPPEDAEMALKLRPMPETAEKIAKRLKVPVEEMRTRLDEMGKKGQIGLLKWKGKQRYALMPFVVGIFEFQLEFLDEEFAGMVAEYMPTLMKTVGGHKPALARVVPVNKSIDAEARVLRYEDMRGMINEAKSFVIRDCICRKEKELRGKSCDHTHSTCLEFSNQENAYDYFTYSGRIIRKEEALELLEKFEEEGLVHCTYNVKRDNLFVCNCCSCCCGFLLALKKYKAPYLLTSSNFIASIDMETCSECGVCADERCPIEAIEYDDGTYQVLPERCIGCGVCTITCPTDSITMSYRPKSDWTKPPGDIITWSMARSLNRFGTFGGFKKLMSTMK